MKWGSRLALALARRIPRGYWPLLRAAANRDSALHDLPISLKDLPGQTIRADLRESVFTSLFRWGDLPHHRWLGPIIDSFIQPGDRVYDVGANIGYVSMLFAERVGPHGTVHAFEPSRRSYHYLLRNTEELSQIKPHRIGAGRQCETVEFCEAPSLDLSKVAEDGATDSYPVEVTSLDSFAEAHGVPSFIKIDVEGYEEAVFAGMKQMLREARPTLLFEALDQDELSKSVELLTGLSGSAYDVQRAPGAKCNYLALAKDP